MQSIEGAHMLVCKHINTVLTKFVGSYESFLILILN